MLFAVKDLLPPGQRTLTIEQECSVGQALALMSDKDYSQLPVVRKDGKSEGLAITTKSILDAIKFFKTAPENLKVRDAVTPAQEVRSDTDLLDALDDIQRETFVLVVDAEERLIGIVTTADTTSHFRKYAEDLMVVQFVETTIREAIELLYVHDDKALRLAIERVSDRASEVRKRVPGAISAYLTKLNQPAQLDAEALKAALAKLKLADPGKTFEMLTFDELKELLLYHPGAPRLNGTEECAEIRTLLDGVRDIRNKIAHFRGDLSGEERSLLRFAASWLERNLLPSPPEISLVTVRAAETTDTYAAPIEEATTSGDSLYTPLLSHLQKQRMAEKEVALKFEEIESLIGQELPKSARLYRAWWANDPEKPHSALWLDLGWRAQWVNMNQQRVTFLPIAEREHAYIRFFSEVDKRLAKVRGFPVYKLSPQGQNWHILAALPVESPASANIHAAFTRGRRLRIELYLDAFDAPTVKRLFDSLLEKKLDLEPKISEPVAWERMDNKRASRIAVYKDGQIMDSPEQLSILMDWIVKEAQEFYGAFSPLFPAVEVKRPNRKDEK